MRGAEPMSFQEKSAWGMATLLVVAGLVHLWILISVSQAIGAIAPAPIAIIFTMLVVLGAIGVQLVLAIASPRAALAPEDERERLVTLRANHWSGLMFGACAIFALGHFMVIGDGAMLFHLILGGLILSQIAEYALQITYLRRRI
jgi:hypothetical protein